MILRIAENHGMLEPATNEFQDCFSTERTRTLVFARAFLYVMKSDKEPILGLGKILSSLSIHGL